MDRWVIDPKDPSGGIGLDVSDRIEGLQQFTNIDSSDAKGVFSQGIPHKDTL